MRLTVYEPKEINITSEQMKEVTTKYLRSLVGGDTYLRCTDTGWVIKEDDDHYHGSISEVYVRDATNDDRMIFAVLEILKHSK